MKRDPQGRWFVGLTVTALAAVLVLITLLVPKWDLFWRVEAEEWGWRGLDMNTFTSERTRDVTPVPPPLPPADPAGQSAAEVYENVQVLGHLDYDRFNRLMQAITEWVSPQEGCAYCHNLEEGFASDDVYAKKVARVMLVMTQHINESWSDDHVGPTGVTCYTCHRGQNVPPWHWFKAAKPAPPMGGIVGMPPPWVRTADTIRDFLPREAFERYLLEDHQITGSQPRMVQGAKVSDITAMENVYLFMMQMADGMGVNCTFCHNSRAFYDWEQSTPNRITGWYAIRMTRQINRHFIEPVAKWLPDAHKGPLGDSAKADCMTCHAGQRKPLGGAPMLADYPSLASVPDQLEQALREYLPAK